MKAQTTVQKKPVKVIKSYVYQLPIKSEQPLTTEAKTAKIEAPVTKAPEINASEAKVVNVKAPVPKVTDTSPAVKTPRQASATFNPYKGIKSINKQLDEKMLNEHFQQRQQSQGISPLQALLPSVPESVLVKSKQQIRVEATTQIGNETFVKLDGTCMQTTNWSNVDENIGSHTSFSDCGETDDEKYFREFMANKLSTKNKK